MYCETIIAMKYHQNIVYFKKIISKRIAISEAVSD